MRVCENCGKEVQEDAKFCWNCGATIGVLTRPDNVKSEDVEEGTEAAVTDETGVVDFNKLAGIETKSEQETESANVKQMRKWGWGWYLLSGLLYVGYKNTSSPADMNSTASNLGLLVGITVALVLYFYLRKHFFKNFKESWTRSFTAGLVSYVVAAFLMGFIRAFGRSL